MRDQVRRAGSARVPASGHPLAVDRQISTSAREPRMAADSCPFGGGPCRERTPRDYEACRKCSPTDPSRDPSIHQPLQVASMPITSMREVPYCYVFVNGESTGVLAY